ncbi:DUF4328 domain-containing protein [Mycobacterium hubeiense]|uniref:DUF4328 domain-containing protein n=1 Tax=Mycobacterium hubeiense TaxID=1867256 RepID=UPI000C7EE3DE|nr:DUF4328 domain-containing protein [Mycobacterium sp. QGD 101]
MIQVCSQCGTRWNVRDRQRVWCPRCHGTLLAPSGPAPDEQWRPTAPSLRPSSQGAPPRLPPGYRWIAVRPGAPPPPRRRRLSLGPTPRYSMIPRWGLQERYEATDDQQATAQAGPSVAMVRATLIATMVVLGVAALVHVIRYGLLLINRTVLLNPWIAGVATWLGVLVSVLALFTVVASVVVLTNWLIARRGAAYAHHGHPDPRSLWQLRLGALVPIVQLVWAPVFVLELANVEGRSAQLRRPIVAWWIAWVFSTAVSLFSIATSFTTDPQGIADNTVTTTIAYLLALAALLLAFQVFLGFESKPVERPAKRWVIVADETQTAPAVESEGQNPAA